MEDVLFEVSQLLRGGCEGNKYCCGLSWSVEQREMDGGTTIAGKVREKGDFSFHFASLSSPRLLISPTMHAGDSVNVQAAVVFEGR